MKRAVGLVVAAAACAMAACELVAGIQDRVLVAADDASVGGSSDSSTIGLPGAEASSAADGPGAPADSIDSADAGGATNDASSASDAPEDAAAPTDSATTPVDAGSPVDALVDVGPVVDASSGDGSFVGTPCSQQINFIFCDDFDSVTDATTNWTWTAFTLDGGSVQLAQNQPATPPNDMQVFVPALQGDNSIGKVLGTIDQFTLAFDLRLDVDSLSEIPYTIVAQIIVGQADGGSTNFNYSLGSGATRAAQIFVNGQQTFLALPAPPTRQWVHITMGYSAATGFVTTQDGVSIGGDAGTITLAAGAGTLIMGDVYGTPPTTGPSGTLTYSIDDVVIQGSQ
jgi:hypothetical protein